MQAAIAALALGAVALATPPAPSRATAGSRNIRDFAPAETVSEVDAQTNLRVLFETLGPEAIAWYQHVLTLSNPWFEGRAPGSDGIERAAEYIEWWMDRYGLEPAFPDEGSTDASVWTSRRQWLELPGGGFTVAKREVAVAGEALAFGEDFVVLGSSGSGEIEAPVAFVGYGLREGRDGYTSFDETTRLDGRIALLLRYEPLDEEGRSLWNPRRFSEHAAILPKLTELVARGAAGVILVNPPGAEHGRAGLESVESSRFGGDFAIPMVQLSEERADALLRRADSEGRGLMEWRRLADTGAVRTVELSAAVPVRIASEVVERRIRTCNVGGVVPGRGDLADEWIVIGAHYDHVGMGLFGTARDNRGQLHPGADDNASGTAALLMLGRRLAERRAEETSGRPMRSILLLAFTAEESGLHGSRYFVRNPTVPGDRTSVMVNLDMIGRMRNDQLSVSGTGTAEGLEAILQPHFDRSSLKITPNPSGRGPSDHANFYGAGIPVIFPFTGLHPDYHTPRDLGYTVNPAGAVKIMDLIEGIVVDLAERPDRLVFSSGAPSTGQDRGYARVRLGVTPSMGGEEAAGVLVEAVADGTSAADAGIQPGDLLIAWNGEELTTTGSMMEQLRNHQPGDVVQIVLMRGGERVVLSVTLKPSQPREG